MTKKQVLIPFRGSHKLAPSAEFTDLVKSGGGLTVRAKAVNVKEYQALAFAF